MATRVRRAAKQNAADIAGPSRRATRVKPGGRLLVVDPQANSRLFIFLAGTFLHRVERERREIYLGDLDLARIAEVIGLAAVEPGMRDAAFRDRYRSFGSIVGIEGQRATNTTSIAVATGIPRETVRRHLKRLLAEGLIVRKGRSGYVLQPGMLQQPDRQAAFAHIIEQIVRFMNDLLEHGLVSWSAAGRAARSDKESRA